MKKLVYQLLCLTVFATAQAAPATVFVPNRGQIADTKGQLHPEILYKYEGEGANLYFLKDRLVYHFIRTEEKSQADYTERDRENFRNGNLAAIGKKVYFHRLDLRFDNANPKVEVVSEDQASTYSNYYLGHCPQGILDVEHYGKLVYKNLYEGIDLAFYFKEGKLKYDFIVAPGADISQIKLFYEGAQSIEQRSSGEIVVKTPVASLTEGKPYTYDKTTGQEIPSRYTLKETAISFSLGENVLPNTTVIDPTVTWSTYFNNGSSSDTWTKPAFDATGAFYNAGYTYYTSYPLINAGGGQYFDNVKDGITDLVIVKFASNYAYTWSTYYGGDGGDYLAGYTDYGKALAVDASNNVYFSGSTDGTTFPTQNPGGAAFYQDQTRIFSETSFFVKLNSSGVRQWASMYQHEAANTMSGGIRVNGICIGNGNLYFTGQTYRFNSNDIPNRTLAGAYNNATWKGPQDVFIGRFNGSTYALEWSSYLNDGGSSTASYRQGCDLVYDNSGLWFVGRHTVNTSNAGHLLLNPGGGAYYQSTNAGDQDLIITHFNTSLTAVYSTYYGGNDQDIPAMINSNSAGDVAIVLRSARSTTFPTFDPGGGAYYQSTKAATSASDPDAAIVKLSTAGVRQWATYYGGAAGASLFSGIGFDASNNMYVFGSTVASNFPTQSLAGSYNDATMGGTGDVVLLKFNSAAVRQWSTFYGGSGAENLYSPKGEVMASGCNVNLLTFPYSSSTDFPTTDPGGGAFFQSTASTANVNTILLMQESIGSLSTNPTSATATSTTICSGSSTTLSVVGGSLGTGATWEWYSGSCGGSPIGSGTSLAVSPTSTTTYFVRAEGTCNTTTCASVTITVNDLSTPAASISATSTTICSGSSTTLSVVGGSLGTGANWQWYTASCGGTAAGSGTSITVSPTSTTTYFVRAEGTCNNTTCAQVTITVNSPSTAPVAATATSTTVCPGNSTNLFVVGGSLGTGANWQWYSGSCGGTSVGSGSSIAVSPAATTTYFVRAEGTCNNTACVSVTITVNTNSTAPTSASATATTICSGGSTTLSVVGGSLGTGATFQWYSGSCGGTSVGSGTSITVSPTSTTTYFVRAEGTCNTTTCASVNITVNNASTAATSISAAPPGSICSGSGTTLSVVGGSLGTGANWQWYTGSCGGTAAGSGAFLSVSPTSTTTYFVRAEGTCNTTTCVNVTVNVNTLSTAPTSATATATTICSGSSTTLSVVGGSLGTTATWEWYSGSCGGTFEGSGSSISVSPTTTTTYFVRGEGPCNTTTCASVTINVNSPSVAPTTVSATATTICAGNSSTLTVTDGSLGIGATWQWYSGTCGGTPEGSGTSIAVSPTTTTTYFVRAEGSCNITTCASVTINVNTASTAPTSINAAATTVCSGSNATLTVVGGSLGAGAQFDWYSGSCGGTPVGTGSSITVPVGSTTDFYVNAVGMCNTTTCAQITITAVPGSTLPSTINISSNPICPGSPTILSFSDGVLETGATWQWYSGSCGGTPEGSGTSISVSPTVTTTYFVRAEGGACGVTACQTVTVNVNSLSTDPTSISATLTTVCSGGSTTLTVIGGSLGSGASWDWYSGGCGGTSVGTGTSVTVNPTVTTTYFVRAQGTCNTTACVSLTINVNPLNVAPTSINASSTSLCAGSITMTPVGGSLGPGATYTWYTGSCGGTLVGSGSPFTVSPATPTTYFVNITGGCNTTTCASVSITASPVPAAWTPPSPGICESASSLDLNTLLGTTPTGGTWYGTNVTGPFFNPNGLSGTVTISYVLGSGSCKDSVAHNITILAAPPVPAVSASSSSVCSGTPVTISANEPANIYDASTGGTLLGPAPLVVSPGSVTTYYVEAVNAAGCVNDGGRIPITITVFPTPTANAGPDVGPICAGDDVTLTATGGGTYQWSTGATTASITVTPLTDVSFIVTVTTGGCSDSDTVQVAVISTTDIIALNDIAAVSQDSTSVTVNVAANDIGDPLTVYIVTPPTHGTATVNSAGNIVYVPEAGYNGSDVLTYSICSNICGNICATAQVTIEVTQVIEVKVPGGISPNGDGMNDFWHISGIEQYPENELTIFNRWGDKVYSAAPYTNDWHGQSNNTKLKLAGDQVVDGTYFYILKLGPGQPEMNGPIELIRNK